MSAPWIVPSANAQHGLMRYSDYFANKHTIIYLQLDFGHFFDFSMDSMPFNVYVQNKHVLLL